MYMYILCKELKNLLLSSESCLNISFLYIRKKNIIIVNTCMYILYKKQFQKYIATCFLSKIIFSKIIFSQGQNIITSVVIFSFIHIRPWAKDQTLFVKHLKHASQAKCFTVSRLRRRSNLIKRFACFEQKCFRFFNETVTVNSAYLCLSSNML